MIGVGRIISIESIPLCRLDGKFRIENAVLLVVGRRIAIPCNMIHVRLVSLPDLMPTDNVCRIMEHRIKACTRFPCILAVMKVAVQGEGDKIEPAGRNKYRDYATEDLSTKAAEWPANTALNLTVYFLVLLH
jgi:hypothetical protein